jgi:hypothetical protein
MNKLWTFGDSFTAGNGCLNTDPFSIEYKQNENDLIWTEIVSKSLDYNLVNCGVGLYSNDKIIDSIIENYHFINKNDIVIIGTTFYSRFDVPYNNTLITLSPTNLPENDNKLLYEMIVIMDNELLKKRQLNRIIFFKDILKRKGVKCLLWEVETQWDKYESIKEASFNKIIDLHWSYKGHALFSNYIINRIKNNII